MSEPTPVGALAPSEVPRSERLRGVGAELVLLMIGLAVRIPAMGQSLLVQHGWRQTQTAWTSILYHRNGVDLWRPTVPVFGRTAVVAFEFPLFQLLGATLLSWGLPVTAAMRWPAVACFLLTALLLCGVMREIGGRAVGIASLVVFLFNPHSLFWSRASLPEYLATAGAVGAWWSCVRWARAPRARTLALASVVATVAWLVKITTATAWAFPVLVTLLAVRGMGRVRRLVACGVVLGPGFVLTMAWTRWVDGLKDRVQLTEPLTSAAVQRWNFGTLGQRLSWASWRSLDLRVLGVGGSGLLVLVCAVAVIGVRRAPWDRERLALAALAATVLSALLVYTNLYLVHSYYPAAINPAVSVLIAVAGVRALRWLRARMLPLRASAAAVVLVLAPIAFVPSVRATYTEKPNSMLLEVADELRRASGPDELVGVMGVGWSPELLYAGDREGVVMWKEADRQAWSVPVWRREGVRTIAVAYPFRDPLELLSSWPWVGSVSRHVVRLGVGAGDPRAAGLAFAVGGRASITGTEPGTTFAVVPWSACRSGWRVPPGRVSVVHLAGAPSDPTARISADPHLAPLPLRDRVRLDGSRLPAGSVLRCRTGRLQA